MSTGDSSTPAPRPEIRESDGPRDPVEALAEEFLERRRRGERPTVSEYASRHPDIAAEILDIFPTLLDIEQAGAGAGAGTGAGTGSAESASAGRRGTIPIRIADYRILREIGRGGMGVVYEAEQVSLGRRVALKVLPLSGLGDERLSERFRREARAAARLHHSHIVPVYETGECDGVLYYAMQFIDGCNLSEVLEDVRRLRSAGGEPPNSAQPSSVPPSGAPPSSAQPSSAPPNGAPPNWAGSKVAASSSASALLGDETPSTDAGALSYFRRVAGIARQAAEALAYAHEEGVLHRDVKPSNLLLDVKGNVWVADFGLAKAEGSTDITLSGDVVGTIAYLAPERLHGWCDPRSDVYSLGLTLYELLTLRRAFPQPTRAEVLEAVARRDPAAPRKIVPAIPRDLETIVLKAIDKSPAFRYESAREMASDLGRFLEIRPILAKRASTVLRAWRWCQRSPVTAGFAAATLLLLVAMSVGASIAAFRFQEQRNAARLAEGQAADRLVDARIAAARWRREARWSGQRFESRRQLEAVAAVRQDSAVTTEAVACFGLFDFEIERKQAIDYVVVMFDRALERYALGRPDGSVEIRRFEDGGLLTRLLLSEREPLSVNTLQFSASGAYLAVGLDKPGGYEILIVDPKDGREILRTDSPGKGFAFDFAPGERRIALRGPEGGIEILSFEDPALPPRKLISQPISQSISQRGYFPTKIAYDPDGKRLASLRTNPGSLSLLIWSVEEARLEKVLMHGAIPRDFAWHPSGKLLAVASSDFHTYLWDVEAERILCKLSGHRAEVSGVAFSPTGEIAGTRSWDGTTRFYDVATGALLAHGLGGILHWGPDGRSAGFSRGSHTLGRWKIAPGDEVRRLRFRVAGKGVRTLAISPEGDLVAAACGDEGLQVTLASGGPRWLLASGPVLDTAFLPDGSGLIAGAKKTLLYPIERSGSPGNSGGTGHSGETVRFGAPRVVLDKGGAVALSFDGDFVACGDDDGAITIVDLSGRSDPRRVGKVPNLTRLALSRGGRLVAVTARFPSRGIILDGGSGAQAHALPQGGGHLTFSPDGSRLFVCAASDVRALEIGTWRVVWSRPRDEGGDTGGPIAVSRDSRLVFAQVSRNRVGLFDAMNGGELAQLTLADEGDVSCFSIGGESLLAIGSTGDNVQLWDLAEVDRDLEKFKLTLGFRMQEPRPGQGGSHGATSIEVAGSQGPMPLDIGPRFRRKDKVEGLTEIIQADPKSPEGYTQRAETMVRRGHRAEAIADLARALERKPKEPSQLWLQRAKLLDAEGRLEECAADSQHALELDPKLIEARKLRASALDRLGREAEALGEWETAREAAPHDAVVLEGIAWIQLTGSAELRDVERALSLAREAALADPRLHTARRTLGIACWRSGLADEAWNALERAAALPGGDASPSTWLFLAMARAKGGDAKGARTAFDRGAAQVAERERQSAFPASSLRRLHEIRDEAARALGW